MTTDTEKLAACRECGAPCRVETYGPSDGIRVEMSVWACSQAHLFGGKCPSDTGYLSEEAWNTRTPQAGDEAAVGDNWWEPTTQIAALAKIKEAKTTKPHENPLADELEVFLVSHPDRDALNHPLFGRILTYLRTPQAGDAEQAKEAADCGHDWRYTGTDYHGSHKGEDHFKCRKCRAWQYRLDGAPTFTSPPPTTEQVEAIRDQLGPKFKHLAPEVTEELVKDRAAIHATDKERVLRELLREAKDFLPRTGEYRDSDNLIARIDIALGDGR